MNYHSWRPVIVAITIAGMFISFLVLGVILSFYATFSGAGAYLYLKVVDCTEEEGPYLDITQRDLTDYPTLKKAIEEILQTNKTSVSIRFQDSEELERTESEFIHGYPIVYNQYCFEISIIWVD